MTRAPPDLFPFGCVGLDYFATLVGKTAVPLAVILLGFLTHAILKRLAGPSKPLTLFVAEASAAFAFLLLIVACPSACLAVFQFFVCSNLNLEGESGYGTQMGTRFLLKDYSIDCNGAVYRSFLPFIYAMIGAWPIGAPAFMSLMLFKDRAVFKRIRQAHETSGPAAGKERRSELTFASRFLSAGYTTKCFWCARGPIGAPPNLTQHSTHTPHLLIF